MPKKRMTAIRERRDTIVVSSRSREHHGQGRIILPGSKERGGEGYNSHDPNSNK